jgi:hypothetical protein
MMNRLKKVLGIGSYNITQETLQGAYYTWPRALESAYVVITRSIRGTTTPVRRDMSHLTRYFFSPRFLFVTTRLALPAWPPPRHVGTKCGCSSRDPSYLAAPPAE